MSTEILGQLFGSPARIKIIRLFLMNPDSFFSNKEVSKRASINTTITRKEINLLKKVKFIEEKTEKIDELVNLKNGKIRNKRKTLKGLKLNPLFPFLRPLKTLIIEAAPIDKQKLTKRLDSAGKVKLVLFSGIFIQEDNCEIDLLIVGDSLKKPRLERTLRGVEAVIGKELNYAIFSTQEFRYRVNVYDRFVRDILDSPHEKALNKLDL